MQVERETGRSLRFCDSQFPECPAGHRTASRSVRRQRRRETTRAPELWFSWEEQASTASWRRIG